MYPNSIHCHQHPLPTMNSPSQSPSIRSGKFPIKTNLTLHLPSTYQSQLKNFPENITRAPFSNTYTDQQEYISIDHINPTCQESCSTVLQEEGRPRKPISFSFFGFSKWRKGCDEKQDKGRQGTDRKQKRKSKFNLSTVVKRYMRFINQFLSLRNKRMNPQFHGKTFSSFSGNLRVRNKKELRGRRGEFSAPASMRNSPTNSGPSVASGTATPTARESTMEELQAAIAHCKKSVAAEETIHVK